MQYDIETIPHSEQFYDTCGNYWTDDDGVKIVRISELGNPDLEFLVLLHEMIEQKLCEKRGITDEKITKFDEAFEAKRKSGNTDEPGDAVGCPYGKEHFFASTIERLILAELGVDMKKYEEVINSLEWEQK
jgi:hypothetical protein